MVQCTGRVDGAPRPNLLRYGRCSNGEALVYTFWSGAQASSGCIDISGSVGAIAPRPAEYAKGAIYP